jgi:phosphate/sulfate permease
LTKDLKFNFVIKEILVGLGCGVIGAILCSIIVSLVFGWLDLFASTMYALIGGYIGMLTGIGIVGYKVLTRNDRQKDFLQFFLQGLVGFAFGLLGLYIISWNARTLDLPNALINFLAIGLPLTCTMLGFNFNLGKLTNENDSQKTGDKETPS